jgi:hypothetical protein
MDKATLKAIGVILLQLALVIGGYLFGYYRATEHCNKRMLESGYQVGGDYESNIRDAHLRLSLD